MYIRLPLDPRLLVVTLDIPADSKSELPLSAPSVEADGFVRKAGCLKRGKAFNLSLHRFSTPWPRSAQMRGSTAWLHA
ncbi:hypothetical protein CSHISOI_01805 [Colletotrichum shisoi]|uniref:Uncharacterized protein n=1 Tax=Colletotrichum shisoi TaxID=2078593 RepID=A0A5Q4C3N0_9PEZI|nr:hypothetical protein CSHISOI_01805 [Colletotrichum shisoi]